VERQMVEQRPRAMVIIPTYDEIDNVKALVPKILALGPNLEVLVVDDNSPDGTGQWVEGLSRQIPRLHCLRRPGKMGLGSAYRDGFRYALAHGAELVFEMDADFSHDPMEIPNFIEAARTADLVLGSRYLTGVTVVNWPLRRLMLSYMANLVSRILTGLPVKDATGGYKCFRRSVLEAIDLDRIKSDGYSFQIEVSFHAWRMGFRIKEIPILFVDRRAGISKMNRRIIVEALLMVWRLALVRLLRRRTRGAVMGADR
jgi:dolichol-phosphate mannosyltransferase